MLLFLSEWLNKIYNGIISLFKKKYDLNNDIMI